MAWFKNRNNLPPLRNTTGWSVTANAGFNHSHVENRPNLGKLQKHTGLPPLGRISAHLPDPRRPGALTADKAQVYIAQLKAATPVTTAPLNARTEGRVKHFLKSAANTAGSVVGIGRGRAPKEAVPRWVRPDMPPVEIDSKKPWIESKAAKAQRRAVEADVAQKANEILTSSKLPLRVATERKVALDAQVAHVESLTQSMLQGVQQARAEHVEKLQALQARVAEHTTAATALRETGARLMRLESRNVAQQERCRIITAAIRANTTQTQALEAQLAALPAAPSAGKMNRAVQRYENHRASLQLAKQRLASCEADVETAQTSLGAAKQRMRCAPRFSQERATCRRQVQECRRVRNQAIDTLVAHHVTVAEREGKVQASGEALTALEQQVGGGERARIQLSLDTVRTQRAGIVEAGRVISLELRRIDRHLPAAREAHQLAEAAELSARLEMDRANRAQALSQKQAEDLERELPNLEPLRKKLTEHTQQVQTDAQVLSEAERLRVAQKIRDLIAAPPGFDRSQVTPALRRQMRELARHLTAVPADLDAQQAQVARRDRIPVEHAMEIISRCLSMATKGLEHQGDEATEVLANLMNRSFAGLVPHRDKNFNGQDQIAGNPLDDDSALKRFVMFVADRPSGLELLKRSVQPSVVEPSRQLQDAVAVYFKATSALSPGNRPSDTDSVDWLHYAEQAAKILAHPPQGQDEAGALRGLARIQRVAFNGVRNGYTSIAPGSTYQEVNKSLEKLAGEWVDRATQHRAKTSPLHARHMGVNVAADVEFPTVENKLSKELGKACDELIKHTDNALQRARTRINAARLAAGPQLQELPQVPVALLEAHTLLKYIQKRGQRGERLDTLPLQRKAWRSIAKKVNTDCKAEAKAGHVQSGRLKDKVDELRARGLTAGPRVPEAARADLGVQPEFEEMKLLLRELELNKAGVLQVLQQLKRGLVDDPNLAAEMLVRAAGSPLPAAAQEAVAHDGIDDDGDDESFHSARSEALSDEEVLDDPTDADSDGQGLQQRLLAFNVPIGQAPAQSLEQRLEALRNRPEPSVFQAHQANPVWTVPEGDEIVAGDMPSDASTVSQASARSDASDLGVRAREAVDEELGALDAELGAENALPQTPLDQALAQAQALHELSQRFQSSTGEFTAEELTQWVSQFVVGSFGNVTLNQGSQFSIGSNGFLGVFYKLSEKMGLVVRPDVEYAHSRNHHVSVGHDALGLQLNVGKTTSNTGTVGLSAAAFAPVVGSAAGGPTLGLNHTISQTKGQGGAVLRTPKFDGKTHEQLTEEFQAVVQTTLQWREMQDPAQPGQVYSNPMEALLDRHPAISMASVERSQMRTHIASSNVGFFMGPAWQHGPNGNGSTFVAGGANVTSTKVTERSHFKTVGGTQGFVANVDATAHTVSANVFAGARSGYSNPDGPPHLAGIRHSLAGINASLNLRKNTAQAGFDTTRFPDGLVVADRFVEYTDYGKFEAAVNKNREKWIQAGIESGTWPPGCPESDKRQVAEGTLDDFMVKAKASLAAGTVTFQENMDCKLEVCSLITANLALEEVALLEGREVDAMALRVARDKILQDDSSYQPFFLKVIANSAISNKQGFVAALGPQVTKGASAAQVFDWYPRAAS